MTPMDRLWLRRRRFLPELMDQPSLDVASHEQALRGLGRLNAASGASRQLWRRLKVAGVAARSVPWRLLDVASGGGDVPIDLWKLARRDGVDLQICGVDASPTACAFAQRRADALAAPATFHTTDITAEELPCGFDIVTCSLFLHHLTVDDAVALLAKLGAAGRLAVVSDLRRSTIGLALAHLACRTLTRSPIVRFDGPQSVANAFTCSEMRELCRRAGMESATVEAAWPFRLLVTHRAR
jgi:2-polyprenyl-3-methyl-5-hydroxy-6-metoxy-1,4-benzoquinol methylase